MVERSGGFSLIPRLRNRLDHISTGIVIRLNHSRTVVRELDVADISVRGQRIVWHGKAVHLLLKLLNLLWS